MTGTFVVTQLKKENEFMNMLQLMGAYSISKTALFGMTKALVPQLSRLNIRVNCIAPGLIKTRFSEAVSGLRFIVFFEWNIEHCFQ